MRFTSTIGGALAGSLLFTTALAGVTRVPSKRQDLQQLADSEEVDDYAEDVFEDLEEEMDDNEDEFEALEEAAGGDLLKARSIVVRATPDGYTSADMGGDPAVGAKVYTEGLGSCIGLLASGTVESGETVNVLQHLYLNDQEGIKDQWNKWKAAVYGAGYTGVRLVMSSSNPDQMTAEAAVARDQQVYVNNFIKSLMNKVYSGIDPADHPHDGNKGHQLPHGTIQADGATIWVNGQQI